MLPWATSVLIAGDAAVGVAALKETDGPELQVHGSGNLLQTLLRAGLIDEFRLWTFPVVLGSGKRLFADGTIPAGLRLTDSVVSTTGVVMSIVRTGRRGRDGLGPTARLTGRAPPSLHCAAWTCD